MVAHNNQIPQARWRKKWQERVKLNFEQPQKAKKRRLKRQQKAVGAFPRPVESLRPVVRTSNFVHNARPKYGRGFTIGELKAAGIPALLAPTIGISVDARRRNKSQESLDANVQRLKEYKAKLVLFPLNSKAPKTKGAIPEATFEEAKQNNTQLKGTVLPISNATPAVEWKAITDIDKKKSAVKRVKRARRQIREVGYLVKKQREAALGLPTAKKSSDAPAADE